MWNSLVGMGAQKQQLSCFMVGVVAGLSALAICPLPLGVVMHAFSPRISEAEAGRTTCI